MNTENVPVNIIIKAPTNIFEEKLDSTIIIIKQINEVSKAIIH